MKICPVCSSQFQTKALLKSHVFQQHSALAGRMYGRAPTNNQGGNRRRQPRGGARSNGTPSAGPPIAVGSVARMGGTGAINQRFSERLNNYTIAKNISAGTIICEIPFHNRTPPRLRVLSRAFQRIRYHQLHFTIVGSAPTTAGGSYVAGFVPDPEDDEMDLAKLQATPGAVAGKWWDTVTVKANVTWPEPFFTSGDQTHSQRWHSPGRFYVFCDSPPVTAAGVTVTVNYHVTLSVPSIENVPTHPKTIVVRYDTLSQKNTHYLTTTNPPGTTKRTEMFYPIPPKGSVYRTPYPMDYQWKEGTGDTGTWNMFYVRMGVTDSDWVAVSDTPDGVPDPKSKWQSNLDPRVMLVHGTVLTLEPKNPASLMVKPSEEPPSGTPRIRSPTFDINSPESSVGSMLNLTELA